MWDEANKDLGVKTEPLEPHSKDLIERYSQLLLKKVKEKLGA